MSEVPLYCMASEAVILSHTLSPPPSFSLAHFTEDLRVGSLSATRPTVRPRKVRRRMRVTPVQYKSGERNTSTLGAGEGSTYAVQHAELGASHAK